MNAVLPVVVTLMSPPTDVEVMPVPMPLPALAVSEPALRKMLVVPAPVVSVRSWLELLVEV